MTLLVTVYPPGGDMGTPVAFHCVPALAYDEHLNCDVITWGRVQRVTWSFIWRYIRELWCTANHEWMTPSGVSPVASDQSLSLLNYHLQWWGQYAPAS